MPRLKHLLPLLGMLFFAMLTISSCFESDDPLLPADQDRNQVDGDNGIVWPPYDGDDTPPVDGDDDTLTDLDLEPAGDQDDVVIDGDKPIDGDTPVDGDGDNVIDGDDDWPPNTYPQIDVPALLTFEMTQLNQSITAALPIRNLGEAPLVILSAVYDANCTEELGVVTDLTSGMVINPGNTQNLILNYTMLDPGVDECQLIITSNDPDANTVNVTIRTTYQGTPSLEIVPRQLDFGGKDILEPAALSAGIRFTNFTLPGSNAVIQLGPFSLQDGQGPFSFESGFDPSATHMLQPGQEFQVVIVFDPQSLDDFSDRLLFESSSLDAQGTVDILGKGVAAQIELSETELAFGRKILDSSTEKTLIITNHGEADAVLDEVVIAGDTDGEFSYDSNGAIGIPFGNEQSIHLKVSYQPTNVGIDEITLGLRGNFYPQQNIDIICTGEGVNPTWTISTSTLQFDSVPVFTTKTMNLTITNTSTTLLEVLEYNLTGDAEFSIHPDDLAFMPTLGVGNQAIVRVQYTPTERAAKAANLEIVTGDPVVPSLDISLSGQGAAPTLDLARADGETLEDSLYFDTVVIGGQNQIQLLVSNEGEVPLILEPFDFAPDTQTAFSFSPDPFPAVEPMATETLTLIYEPQLPPGVDSVDLTITSNDPLARETQLNLSGVGINPNIQILPFTTYDFGSPNVGVTVGPMEFFISNTGQGALRVSQIEIEMDNGEGTEFFITEVGGSLPYDIDNDTSQTFLSFGVSFLPSEITDYSGRVQIYSNDFDTPVATITLTGRGQDCPENYHDLDDNPADCEYYCEYSNNGVEQCDNEDNDCDGQTDEDYPIDDECDGIGACSIGVFQCHPTNPSLYVCSTDPQGTNYDGSEEICDDMDNDCDGETDEGFDIGQVCDGVGACGAGLIECFDTTSSGCSTDIGGSEYIMYPERCNNLDDDCNGYTDEGFPVNDACEGVGECGGGIYECDPNNDNAILCSTDIGGSEYPNQAELCNGLDDDCDGNTDNGLNLGTPCTPPGECGAGVIECDGEVATRCSTGPGGSEYGGSTEVCDDLDNDCDGQTDETFTLGGTCEGIGACGSGVVECDSNNPSQTICSTDIGGSAYPNFPERCDMQDNDCDGHTDEGYPIAQVCEGVGECGIGNRECDPNNVNATICSTDIGGSNYPNQAEICDGLDNDCDGQTDEDWPIGDACTGSADCPNGRYECAGDTSYRCSTDPGGSDYPSPTEVCDGIDNNCNDEIDEGFDTGAGCDGVGSCGTGVIECDPNDFHATICSTDPNGSNSQAMNEICNQIDDDCDGQTDEDFSVGQSCDGIGECGQGHTECFNYYITGCSTNPGGSDYVPVSEICDELDNDCDGQTDEGFNVGQPCSGVGACGEGLRECDPNNGYRSICSTDIGGSEYDGSYELCDNIDNDCDGQKDEDYSIGVNCEGVGECGQGVYECNGPNTARCSTDIGGSFYDGSQETCNNLDDDCDGYTDEDFNVGVNCDGIGECGYGLIECLTEDSTACSTNPDGSEYDGSDELCDDRDNDCDGSTDEDFELGQTCPGVGECPDGVWQCDGPTDRMCSTSYGGDHWAGSEEICNNLDDDCDGLTDEDFHIGELCDGPGPCGMGVYVCQTDTTYICSSALPGHPDYEGSPETCDNQDNDCDGLTDEDFSIGVVCDGTGECGLGTYECNSQAPGGVVCSTDPLGSQRQDVQETCDELDNDCDGYSDEDFLIGETCEGVGECGLGLYECADINSARCSVDIGGSEYAGNDELCDELDNDCDGMTDEDYDLGAQCDGIGECGLGVYECATDGGLLCSTDIGGSEYPDPAPEELCNGLDDDCNGHVDDGLNLGVECTGTGECSSETGVYQCGTNQQVVCSVNYGGSDWAGQSEKCDDKDNDCDSQTDEDFQIGQLCDGVGECGQGVWECKFDSIYARACSTDPFQSEDQQAQEICDGLDNDCDGTPDDDFGPLGYTCTASGECGTGTYVCLDENTIICSAEWPEHPDFGGADESCNHLDDDCDGQTDEDWNINSGCFGTGDCSSAFGSWWCNGTSDRICSVNLPYIYDDCDIWTNPGQCRACDPAEPGCVANPAYPSSAGEEICDNQDNDCDGETDEDFTTLGDTCDAGGACGNGFLECNQNLDLSNSACSNESDPNYRYYCEQVICSKEEGGTQYGNNEEVCNGIDDDCNGETDSEFGVGNSCTGVGECGQGLIECSSLYTTRCSVDIGGSAYAGTDEICDELDNDCDGQTDEGFSLGLSCNGVGECGAGTRECDPNDSSRAICSTDIGGSQDASTEEICDELDNDCDGLTDEDLGIGDPCTSVGECGSGVYECDGSGGIRCSVDFGGTDWNPSLVETCNYLDDDCDGQVDEGFGIYDGSGERIVCQGSGGCGAGYMECYTSSQSGCSTDPGGSQYDPSEELCNYLDDDCDTEIDEDWPELGQSCDGVGACGIGVYECDSSLLSAICSTDINGSEYSYQPELCDHLDNDCDGLTDEDFLTGEACDGEGECGAGVIQCDPSNPSGMMCSTDIGGDDYVAVVESCDGLDNDCDGLTDEGFPLGDTCDGVGACRIGFYECAADGGYQCSTDPGGSQYDGIPELCNHKDDDCDGLTDEGFATGAVCFAPGECRHVEGLTECGDDFSLVCSTGPGGSSYLGTSELCDDLDNDCDNSTDEDFSIGDSCDPTGECGIGMYECATSTSSRCSTGPGGSASQVRSESCNGKDDDCDGQTDEGMGVGQICIGVGACGSGRIECSPVGDLVCSSNPGASEDRSEAERCDDLDNDCDGETDEDFQVGQACTGVGECGAGMWECASPSSARCSTSYGGSDYQPNPELCDNLDNDCDGQTDEDFNIGQVCNGTGECGTGQYECINIYTAICSSNPGGTDYQFVAELCNALDDNCDGQTDENLGVGEACQGEGICGAGLWECTPSGEVVCSTEAGGSQDQSGTEICDGQDNDCDGSADEGYPIGQSCQGNGDCGEGVYECDDNGGYRCSTDLGGSDHTGGEEVCDHRDNDCDGLTDEDFALGVVCDGVGACGAGVTECRYGYAQTICSTDINGSEYEGQNETCDGQDNDCDGQTDEDFMRGEDCEGIGECGAGVYECASLYTYRCSTDVGGSNYQGTSEICDSLDNDCDGSTDEGYQIGNSCMGDGQCGMGQYECETTNSVRCSTDIGGSQYGGQPELCNSFDDDCDGLTDEGIGLYDPETGNPIACDGVGECGSGYMQCKNEYEVICNRDPGGDFYDGGPEGCDGLDNDCDGVTDEGYGLGAPCQGQGACGEGVVECDPNHVYQTICSTDLGGSQFAGSDEICDNQDNDCDGFTDESWPTLGQECVGSGTCSNLNGVIECHGDNDVICSTDFGGSQYEPSAELCDGKDNNCDGQTDETFDLGGPCDGVGECGVGTLECNDTGGTRCSTDLGGSEYPGWPTIQEICDGLDNDCDGYTDEFFDIGETCFPDGACSAGVIECADDYETRCSTAPGGSQFGGTTELCDNVDNDCDGQTDEGFFIGQSCDGVGQCGQGVIECDTPTTTRCSTDLNGSDPQDSPELCDGLDNDCDGQYDEDFATGESCLGVGECGNEPGFYECAGPNSVVCSTMPGGSYSLANVELCDTLDNDCDGQTDEVFNLGASCQPSDNCDVGVIECDTENELASICSTAPGGSEYSGEEEYCDSLDNDCDGQVDEDYSLFTPSLGEPWPYCSGADCGGRVGTPCQGTGACGEGVWECADDGIHTRCSTLSYNDGRGVGSQYNPVAELCDNIDNDCDGETDEGFNLGQSCTGIGQCASQPGVWQCQGTDSTICSTMPGGSNSLASAELCDNADNDCDGQTDETFYLGQSCEGIGECGQGQRECASLYHAICSTDLGGSVYDGSGELCDGLDNDCDGQTDENWSLLGSACSGGECGTGEWICNEQQDGLTCTAWGGAQTEVCDNLDNDCDGQTDEGFGLGTGCIGVGQCGAGLRECDPGDSSATICSTDLNGSDYRGQPESCDLLDNDCDGQTDEDFREGGTGDYNHPDHCGACDNRCEFAHAYAVCVNSECEFSTCESGYANMNGDQNDGCECELESIPADTCGEAQYFPNNPLDDRQGGTIGSVEGQLATLESVAWYRFDAEDLTDATCDLFDVKVFFTFNPDNAFRFDVYKGGCQGTQRVCENWYDFRDYTNFSDEEFTVDSAGECPCRPAELEPQEGTSETIPHWPFRYCLDDSASYWVMVKYRDDIAQPICDSYTLTASNAR